jgi:phage terminase large subunit GpA-like protein
MTKKSLKLVAPPPELTISQWADRYRRLSPESSAEPGQWRTDRTPYLREPMDCIGDRHVERVVLKTSAQVGKALAIDTPIATPTGWRTMGDLRSGDYVFDATGNPTLVTFATEPMLDRECFEVVFSDGAKIVADADHLWEVDARNSDNQPIRKVMKTKDLIPRVVRNGRYTYSIRLNGPLNLAEKNLPISPYTLGVWLGDGNSLNNTIVFHEDDEEIATNIADDGYSVFVCRRDKRNLKIVFLTIEPSIIARSLNQKSFKQHLKDLSLINNKHIPSQYLRASADQRLDLLQGLMDTDGCVNYYGRCELTTTSEKLAIAYEELIQSLGIRVRLTRSKSSYRKNGVKFKAADRYRLLFNPINAQVFKLKRKQRLVRTKQSANGMRATYRIIRAINPVKSVPVKCIQVANEEKLYLAGRELIPTHNTELINNVVGYFIHQDPSPMLVMQPTLDMAQAYSKDRLAPMIRDTSALRNLVSEVKSKDGGNTLLQKKFPGGHITLCGANSPSSLAMRPVRVVLVDERNRAPKSAGTEGDPVKLAQKRATTFFNRKFVEASTPTIENEGIDASFNESDQRQYFIPCPHCKHMQTLVWERIKFDSKDFKPEDVCYQCENCEKTFDDTAKHELLISGEWRARAEFKGTAGFEFSELYSPWVRWWQTAKAFLEAKDDPEKLKVWINTSLGKGWKAKEGEVLDHMKLYLQRENYQIESVPEPVEFITGAMDVQKDRLEVEVKGWCRDKQSFSIAHYKFYGDTSDASSPCYLEADRVLGTTYFKESGVALTIRMFAADSGYNTTAVYNWSRRHPRSRVMVVKGRDSATQMVGKPQEKDIHIGGATIPRGVRLWIVGTDIIKNELFSWLKLNPPADGGPYPPCFCHFPQYDEDYFKQLTNERLSAKDIKGRKVYFWEKVGPNEAIDLHVYNRAAAHIVGLDRFKEHQWNNLVPASAPINIQKNSQELTKNRVNAKPQPKRRSNYW